MRHVLASLWRRHYDAGHVASHGYRNRDNEPTPQRVDDDGQIQATDAEEWVARKVTLSNYITLHYNYCSILYRLWDIERRIMAAPCSGARNEVCYRLLLLLLLLQFHLCVWWLGDRNVTAKDLLSEAWSAYWTVTSRRGQPTGQWRHGGQLRQPSSTSSWRYYWPHAQLFVYTIQWAAHG